MRNKEGSGTSTKPASHAGRAPWLLLLLVLSLWGWPLAAGADAVPFRSPHGSPDAPPHGPSDQKSGVFLVATDQLHGTSFEQTVILLTHYSNRGATGLAVNRPTDIPVKKLFPQLKQRPQQASPLFLGGPVGTNAIFVLARTQTPTRGMHHIASNVYFATAKVAFDQAIAGSTRTFAGYAGWAPSQLQGEIARGDWLVVHTDPSILFDDDIDTLWQRLSRRWSGNWI